MLVIAGQTSVNAQIDATAFPKLQSRYTRTLTVSDGLPTDCFSNLLVDSSGLVWLVPCGEAQRSRGLHIIQFDGYEGINHPIDLKANSTVLLSEVIGDSVVTGVTIYGNIYWQYNYRNQQFQKFEAPVTGDKQNYIFYSQVVNNRTFVLGKNSTQLLIYELVNGKFELLNSTDATFNHVGFRTRNFPREARAFDNDIYLLNLDGNIIKYDVASNSVTKIPFPDRVSPILDILFEWRGALYWSQRWKGGAIYRVENDSLRPIDLLPTGWKYYLTSENLLANIVSADQRDNIVINCFDTQGSPRSILIDSSLNYWEYTDVSISLPDRFEGRLVGDNFKQSVGHIGSRLSFSEIAQDYGMQTIRRRSARSLTELDSGYVLVFNDGMPQALLGPDLKSIADEDVPVKYQPLINEEIKSIGLRRDGNELWGAIHDTLKVFDLDESQWIRHYGDLGWLEAYELNSASLITVTFTGLHQISTDLSSPPIRISDEATKEVIGRINALIITDTIVWLGASEGLFKYDWRNSSFQKVEEGLSDVSILTLVSTTDGSILIGTEASGVLRFSAEGKTSTLCNTQGGLSHNTVPGMLEDDQGNIWANTFDGINVIRPDGEVIAKFFEEDGVKNNEGNRWSALKHSSGKLIFGSIAGFTVIDPVTALAGIMSQPSLSMFVSRVRYVDRDGVVQNVLNPSADHMIELPSRNRSITLSLGLSDFVTQDENEYEYKFDTPGAKWTPLGSRVPAIISNLPSGAYSIQLRGRNRIGVESGNNVRLRLDVEKPFVQTGWFYFLLALPFIVAIAVWYLRSTRERRRLEEEVNLRTADIARQAEELREMDQLKSRIYTNITHEFRTPITLIKGFSSQLSGDKQSLEMVQRNADRLLNLVNQMLDLSKLESQTLEVNYISGNIVDTIRDIFDSFAPLADAKDQSMHFHARPSTVTMDYDIDLLFRIVGNLLSNAIKYTESGGNIYLDLQQQASADEQLTIMVRDTGIGIKGERLEHVFDRFYQVDSSMTRSGEGTGIGLALVKELVELLDGDISVESQESKGTTFIVNLPIHHNAEAVKTSETFDDNLIVSGSTSISGLQGSENISSELPTVLVVEDTPDLLHYVTMCLKGDYNVILAMDGQAGTEKAITEVPDVIVSDVMMPVKNGYELCTAVKEDEHSNHIPVILLTAKADAESRIEGLEVGADAYITKPFEKEELLLTVRNAVNSSLAMRKRYEESSGNKLPANDDPIVKKQDEFINRLNEVIDQNMEDEEFGVMPLSRAMQYSRSQLHNKVKALTGHTISTYIQTRRLNRAKSLLNDPNMNVSEVAWAVGFKDPNYFSRLFKREFGMSPSEFVNR